MVLRNLPEAIYVELQDVEQSFLPAEPCPHHTPQLARIVCDYAACLWCDRIPMLKVSLPGLSAGQAEEVMVKVGRTQMPLVTVKASTLHVLPGTTTDPGLIFHWRFPRRLQKDMRWLACYVALSQVRSLDRLRSVGLDLRA